MAKTKLYLDTRGVDVGAEAPVKIRISQGSSAVLITTGISVRADQWDAQNQFIIAHRRKTELNSQLAVLKAQADDYLFDLRRTGMLDTTTAAQIREGVARSIASLPKAEDKPLLFIDMFARVRDAQRSDGSKSVYDQTLSRLRAYDPKIETRTFDDLDVAYINSFDMFLSRTNTRNSRNVYHRSIRTVFNAAIDEGVTTMYPYRKFKIRTETSRDKALSAEDLRTLFSYPCEPWQQEYVDMFKLAFLLIGINAADLVNLKDIKSGRVEYRRQKTGKFYSVKVLPEAAEIIERYKGRKQLLSPLDRYASHKDYLHHMNSALKTIGMRYPAGCAPTGKALFPDLTSGYARTTWATIATELDIPRETISAALGHWVVDVTATYIRLDMRKKVDAANRAVADYILYGKR